MFKSSTYIETCIRGILGGEKKGVSKYLTLKIHKTK